MVYVRRHNDSCMDLNTIDGEYELASDFNGDSSREEHNGWTR